MKSRAIVLFIASTTALPLAAEEGQQLPTMTVEGTRQAQTEFHIPIEGIQPGIPADAADFLRDITGISGSRMGGRGIEPVIRGQTQNRLNILLDGAYIHGGCPNRMDPPTAYSPIETYDSVTVIKGSQTVVYGGGGSGGTVLFERRTPRFTSEERFRGKAAAGFQGNSDTKTLGVDLAAGSSQGFVRGIIDYADADNYEDGDGKDVRSAYESRAGNLILGFTPDDTTRLDLTLEATREDDVLFAGAGMDSPKSDNDTIRLKFEREAATGPFSGLRAEVYRSEVDHEMDNFTLRTQTAAAKMLVPSTSDTTGGRVSVDLTTASDAVWTVGLDYQKNERDATRLWDRMGALPAPTDIQSLMWPDVDLEQSGLFAEMTLPVGTMANFSAGIRYDRVDATISSSKANTVVPAGPPPGWRASPNGLYQAYYGVRGKDHDENNVGGFLRYEHAVGGGDGTVYASLSRSVRTADATERYLAANSGTAAMRWIGNPDLKAEKHHQAELGIAWEGRRWDASASVYYDHVDDYILRDRAHLQNGILRNDNATVYRNVDARIYGFEWEGGIRWTDRWSSHAGLALVRSRNRSDNRDIAQTPPLEGSVSLDYEHETWGLGGVLRFADDQNRVDANVNTGSGLDAGKTPGFGTLDLYGNLEVGKRAELRFGVDNVFDKAYAYHVNRANVDPFNPGAVQVNEPGRSAWVRISATF